MTRRLKNIMALLLILSLAACQPATVQQKGSVNKKDWQQRMEEQMPLLGHRNWILIVDKAYPAPNNSDILMINTGAEMIDVLRAMDSIFQVQAHIKPVIYQDTELNYLDEGLVKGVDKYKKEVKTIWSKYTVQEIPHEAIFKKIDEASKLFKVIVLKTESLQPYTSVFIELDCGYWDAKREESLRSRIH
jgi:L-fucose mutarotase/ribose pyranase (RbsD/FucU family)